MPERIIDPELRSESLVHRLAHPGRGHRRHLGPPHFGGGPAIGYGDPSDGQDYVDRSVIDFDPAAGLLCGTALDGDGNSHQHVAEKSVRRTSP